MFLKKCIICLNVNIKGIDTDGITAEYNDGVLTLTMPEKTPEVPAARRLEIK